MNYYAFLLLNRNLGNGKEASVATAVEDEVSELTAEEIIYDHKGH